jgi:hypothetical protein
MGQESWRDREKGQASQEQQWRRERVEEATAQGGRRGVFIPPKKIEPLGKTRAG